MTLVIMWSVADVAWVLYQRATASVVRLLSVNDILASFGAFMTALIVIKIFLNIRAIPRDDVLHVKLVLATALLAIARKVIVPDYKILEPEYIWATAAKENAMSLAIPAGGIIDTVSRLCQSFYSPRLRKVLN